MRSRRLSPVLIVVCVLACQSVRSPDNISPDQPDVPNLTSEELGLVRADSELFEGVVRGQLSGTKKEYPFHLDSPRFDSRPYGTDSAFPRGGLSFEKGDPTFPNRLRPEVVARLVADRKLVLRALDVQEGGPRNYSPCAGILVVPVPPPGGSISREKLAELRAGCPKTEDAYLTVGLPIRGVPEGIRKFGIAYKAPIQLTGEVWTAIVEGWYAGPSGGMWDEHAWMLQRDPSTSRLRLARTLLLGIAE